MQMTKKKLDTLGGIGSILCSLVCVYFAMGHHEDESMWKVWVGFGVLLIINGFAMIVYAQRDKLRPMREVHSGH
jgi:multidrug transporter EmrE-like cation transporter